MRFNICLIQTGTGGKSLPVNYQYELSAWVYKCIHFGDPEFSRWLHETGYSTGAQRFKLFTFSNLLFEKGDYQVAGDRLMLKSGACRLQISFLLPDAATPFIQGIFHNQNFTLGDRVSRVDFVVTSVERMADPLFINSMTFRTLSPVVIGKSRLNEGGKGTEYLSPVAPDYPFYFLQNLRKKAEVQGMVNVLALSLPGETGIQILGEPKQKLILIKSGKEQETRVKGFLFSFRLTAPPEWMKVAWDAGVGEKNSLGMGTIELIH